MWARLQGVGISVRADTALPLPLLHKTSQPALSAGRESVSAATCQSKRKKNLSLPSSSCVTNHPPPLLCSQSFASSLMSCVCRKTRHTTSAVQCSLPLLKAVLPFCPFPVLFQGNLSSTPSGFYILDMYAMLLSGLESKMWQGTRTVAAIN